MENVVFSINGECCVLHSRKNAKLFSMENVVFSINGECCVLHSRKNAKLFSMKNTTFSINVYGEHNILHKRFMENVVFSIEKSFALFLEWRTHYSPFMENLTLCIIYEEPYALHRVKSVTFSINILWRMLCAPWKIFYGENNLLLWSKRCSP